MAEAPTTLRRTGSILSTLPPDAPKYLSDPFVARGPELRAWRPSVSDQIAYWIQNRLEDIGVQPRKASNVGMGARDILGLTPVGIAMAVGDTMHALSRGDYRDASLAALPIIPIARPFAKGARHVTREALFDLSNLDRRPNAPQFDLARYTPPRGVPERTQDLLYNSDVHNGLIAIIEAGKGMGAAGWPNTTPLREEWTKELGSNGVTALRKYLDYVAATSPKSELGSNIRNASLYYHLDMSGKKLPRVGEANPPPFGHIAQRHHQGHAQRVGDGIPFDPIRNPKPASHAENLSGNYAPIAIDTHAFRLPAMVARDERFLKTWYRANKNDPVRNIQAEVRRGDLSMDEAINNPAYWQEYPRPSEYAAMEQLWKRLAEDARLAPAQAQSAAYLVGTNIAGSSSAHFPSFVEALQHRIYKKAKKEKMDPPDVRSRFIRGQMPLISGAGLGGAAVLTQGREPDDQSR